jgi:catechol 2,3-dioxygenase-like lactoylglutathione lyase family enzyme
MISAAIKKQLRLPEVGQVGYVVSDVDRAIVRYKETFGMGPWMLLDGRPEPCIEGGREVHPLLRIALAYAGSVQVEFIQVIEGESFHLQHVGKSEGEVHHLGFMVQDIARRLDAYGKRGIGVLQRGTIKVAGVSVEYAYLDTVGQADIIIELLQWRLGPLPLPVNRVTFNIACGIGAKTLLKGRIIR